MTHNLEEQLDLGLLARMAAVSKFHFIRVFEELTGTSPLSFLSCLRLDKAKSLLATTTLSITDVCMAVGYSSLGSFSTTFKQMVGVSPRDYRECHEARVLSDLDARTTLQPRTAEERIVRGYLRIPGGERGPVLIGVFPTAVPKGLPVAGMVLRSEGPFQLRVPAAGTYFLLAAMLESGGEAPASTARARLVAGLQLPAGELGGRGRVELKLRAPALTDPPVLLSLHAVKNALRPSSRGAA